MTDIELLDKYGEPPSGYTHQTWLTRNRRVEELSAVKGSFLVIETHPFTAEPKPDETPKEVMARWRAAFPS